MRYQKPLARSMFFVFLIAYLLTGLIGTVFVPVSAAPLMQTGTADLSMEISAPSNLTPNKADPVIFTITISNAGPDVATGVTVNIPLPNGLTYVSDSGAGTYNAGIWTVGSVVNGGSVTLNIITNVTTIGEKSISAEVRMSDQFDGDSTPGNGPTTPQEDDYATSSLVTPKVSDLRVVLPVPPSPPQNSSFNIGDIVVFRIEVSNETLAVPGASNATGVRVRDLLPAGLAFISYTSSSGTYSNSTGIWSVGDLDIGATKWLEITASVTNANTKTNIVEVTESDQLDTDSIPANGVATEDDFQSVTLNAPSADLAVSIGVNNAAPNKSDNVIFTITLSNTSTTNATGVTMRDLLPAGLSYQSHSGGTYNSATGIWSIGSLPAGFSNTLTIITRATTTGAKINTASIFTSNQADPVTTNNSASVTVTPRAADLSITKTIDKNAPKAGDTVKFTLTLNNAGPDTANGVTVSDSLPAGFTYISNNGAVGEYNSGSGIWDIGSMPANTTRSLIITATATSNSNKTNKAEVATSSQLDPDSTPNNSSIYQEDDDDAAPKVDLSLTKTVNNAVPAQGANVTFTLKVSNAGPAAATGVFVRDVIPLGLSYISDNGGGSYNSSSGIWTVGTLSVNTSKTLTITVKAASMGTYSNYAQVWASDQYDVDSVPGDNSTSADDDETVLISVSFPSMALLINEVAWMGTAASVNDEWIEIYNPNPIGSDPINLSGWVLRAVDGTPSIPLLNGYFLKPGEFFLLERTDDTTVSDIIANQIYVGDLGNSFETLQLIDPLNRVVDTANSNGGNWPAGSSTTFGSMERRLGMVDSDTAWITNTGLVFSGKDAGTPNDCTITNPSSCLVAPKNLKGTPKNANWANSVVPTPSPVPTVYRTPTAVYVAPPPPALIAINEILPRPGHDWNNDGLINTNDEYIELINHGTASVNLSGYRLDDEVNVGSSPYTLPSVNLVPGQRFIFYGAQTGLLLSDGGDAVRLLKPNGQLMDAYNYQAVQFPDQSFCRLPDNGGADDWNTNCFPTPGLQNSLSGSTLKPPTQDDEDEPLCPIADTLPQEFIIAECDPFGHNIWDRYHWDENGWLGEMFLPNVNGRWPVYAD